MAWRAWDIACGVKGAGCRVLDVECRVEGGGWRVCIVEGLEFKIQGGGYDGGWEASRRMLKALRDED